MEGDGGRGEESTGKGGWNILIPPSQAKHT